MNKKLITAIAAAALSLSISASAFAATGTVERSVNFRSAPSTNSSVYGLLKSGTNVDIISKVNTYWYKISANGKVGYASTNYIREHASSAPAGQATISKSVNFRSAPSTNSSVYRLLKTGTSVQVIREVNSYWLEVSVNGQRGYVSTKYVNYGGSPAPAPAPSAPSAPSSSVADRVIANAYALQGVTRYQWGVNRGPSVLDCSSFTKYVFGQEGISLKWGTRYQKDAGHAVSKSNLKKGDLVFFWTSKRGTINHVGIYIGNGQFIHNSPSFDGVGVSSLNSGYWEDHYVSARRVL